MPSQVLGARRPTRVRTTVALCLLAAGSLFASEAEQGQQSDAEAQERDYSYGAANNEWLMFLTSVGGDSHYEYRLFGDGRLKWEHVHPQTRTIYDDGYVRLSDTEVSDLYELVVSAGVVDITAENRGSKIGIDGGLSDGSTVVLMLKLESYMSKERSESDPFTHTLVVEDVDWMLMTNPELHEVRALRDLYVRVRDLARGQESDRTDRANDS